MKTTFTVDLGGTNQATHDRKLQPGELVELTNYREIEAGELVKRLGLARGEISTFVGSSYIGPATAMECAGAAETVVRDSFNQLWALSGSSAYYRGRHHRCWPTTTRLPQRLSYNGARKSVGVYRAGYWWQFSIGQALPDVGASYQLTVMDPASRVVVFDSGPIAATFIGGCTVVATAAAVRFLYFQDDTGSARDTIFCHTFTTPTVSPTVTTYATVASAQWTSIDAHYFDDTDQVMVAATSLVADPLSPPYVATLWWSLLNTGTNTAGSADSLVVTGGTSADHQVCCGVSIMPTDGSDGLARLAYFRFKDTGDDVELARVAVTLATLVDAAANVLQTLNITAPSDAHGIGVTGSWLADNGLEIYLSTYVQVYALASGNNIDLDVNGGQNNVSSAVTYKHFFDPGTSIASTSDYARSATLAGKPFQVGGRWHAITHFDDFRNVQRAFWVRDEQGIPLTNILDGEACPVFHGGGLRQGSQSAYRYGRHAGHVVTPAVVEGAGYAEVFVPLLGEFLSSKTCQPVMAVLDFEATYHSTATGIVPGGVTGIVTGADSLGELAPLHAPYEPLYLEDNADTATPIATIRWTYRYAWIDSAGSQRVSAPYPTAEIVFNEHTDPLNEGFQLRLPCCRHTLTPIIDAGKLSIILYATPDGGTDPSVQLVVGNDQRADYVVVTVRPLTFDSTGERLDTIGVSQGVLDQSAVPGFRLVTKAKDRTWGVGPDDTIWFSQRGKAGRGPEFNEALTTEWPDGTGPIRAIAPLPDSDAVVVFRSDAVGLITGPGPDGLALNGEFKVQTLPTTEGTYIPHVATGPLGVYYQRADGRMALTTGAGPPVEIHHGMEAYRAFTVVAALADRSDRAIKFWCDNGDGEGEILVIDDAHKTDGSPVGKWYRHRRSGTPWAVPAGVRLYLGSPLVLDPGETSIEYWTPGFEQYDDDGEPVLRKLRTGRLAPAGFLGEFDVREVQVSSTPDAGAGDSIYDYTLTSDQGVDETHEDITDATTDVKFWSGIDRTREVRLTIEETASTGAGRKFDGVAFEINAYGRFQNPHRRIP